MCQEATSGAIRRLDRQRVAPSFKSFRGRDGVDGYLRPAQLARWPCDQEGFTISTRL
jgi:hypothetical protein